MEKLTPTELKYKNSYYIEVLSFKEFEKLSVSKEMTDTMPRIKMIQPKLEAKTENGKYFLKIDRLCIKLLDKMMVSPLLKSRLLTNKQAQAIALKGLPV